MDLSLKQANIIDNSGKLTKSALSNIKLLKTGDELRNKKVISELTRDGSSIGDWAKYATKEAVEIFNGQKIQIHFYRNEVTQKINYNIDYKVVPVISPFLP